MERQETNSPETPQVISMWSAPRSLSTVLLYAFAQHPDCRYSDEPFLWHALKKSETFELQGTEPFLDSDLADPVKQYAALFSDPSGRKFHYVKNMAYQWLDLDLAWTERFTNAFLIRDPEKMVASYLRNCSSCRAEDFALDHLCRIHQRAIERGQSAPVIDADDLLANPELFLQTLCKIIGMPYTPAMLRWEPGPLPGNITLPGTWYDDVLTSSGFREGKPQQKTVEIDKQHTPVVKAMQPFYQRLFEQRITPEKARHILTNE